MGAETEGTEPTLAILSLTQNFLSAAASCKDFLLQYDREGNKGENTEHPQPWFLSQLLDKKQNWKGENGAQKHCKSIYYLMEDFSVQLCCILCQMILEQPICTEWNSGTLPEETFYIFFEDGKTIMKRYTDYLKHCKYFTNTISISLQWWSSCAENGVWKRRHRATLDSPMLPSWALPNSQFRFVP